VSQDLGTATLGLPLEWCDCRSTAPAWLHHSTIRLPQCISTFDARDRPYPTQSGL